MHFVVLNIVYCQFRQKAKSIFPDAKDLDRQLLKKCDTVSAKNLKGME